MKKSIFLFALLIASFYSFGQQYSFVKQLSEVAQKVYPAQNGSFYAISIEADCPDDLVVLRYINSQGNILSTFTSPPYIGYLNSWDAVVTPANHIVVYLRLNDVNHLLYEFDSTGTLIWNNNLQYTNPYVKFTKISQAPGGYYLLGKTLQANWDDSSKGVLAKVNLQGKHKWTKYYKVNNALASSLMYNDMLVDNNHLTLVGRYYYPSQAQGQPPFRPVITILDTAGVLQQTYYYMIDSTQIQGFDKYEFVRIDKTPSGSYYLVANNFGNEHILLRMNNAFNITWVKERLSGKTLAMATGYNEEMFVVPDGTGSFKNAILQIDSTGAMMGGHALKTIPGSDLNYGSVTGITKHDCGFIVTSNYNMLAHTDKTLAYCMDSVVPASYFGNYYAITNHYRGTVNITSLTMANPNEYLSTGTYTNSVSTATAICSQAYSCGGTTNPTEIKNVSTATIDVYPNPATDIIKITVPVAGISYDVVMMDVSGKQVLHSTLQNSKEYTLHLPVLATGLYTIKITGEGSVFVKKLQILE